MTGKEALTYVIIVLRGAEAMRVQSSSTACWVGFQYFVLDVDVRQCVQGVEDHRCVHAGGTCTNNTDFDGGTRFVPGLDGRVSVLTVHERGQGFENFASIQLAIRQTCVGRHCEEMGSKLRMKSTAVVFVLKNL